MDGLRAAVAALDAQRTRVFLPRDEKARVTKLLIDTVYDLASKIDEAGLSAAEKAELAYLRGKCLDAADEPDASSVALLERAVKLQPDLVDAWQCLARANFKRGDLVAAKSCLDQAIRHKPTVEALCLYSMLLRQLRGPGVDVAANIAASVGKAKQAIAVDMADPMGWAMLGNAHLSLFFAAGRNAADLAQASKAHARAAKLEADTRAATSTGCGGGATASVTAGVAGSGGTAAATAAAAATPAALPDDVAAAVGAEAAALLNAALAAPRSLPDLHYNRGTVQMYCEDYRAAMESLALAARLDPSLDEPTAAAGGAGGSSSMIASIEEHLKRTLDLVARRAGFKGKRLREAAAGLQGEALFVGCGLSAAEAAAVAATAGGGAAAAAVAPSATKPTGKKGAAAASAAAPSAAATRLAEKLGGRKRATLATLVPGANDGVFLALRPLVPVAKKDQPPPCMVVVDEAEAAACVAVYHMSEAVCSRIGEKDVFIVLDPVVKVIDTGISGTGADGSVVAAAGVGAAGAAAAAGVAAAATGSSFMSIQVQQADKLLLNGRFTKSASTELHTTAFE